MPTNLISGFTFIKHGFNLGYPIKESIESIEPLCDEIIINVGYDDPELKKDDGTFEYLKDTFNHPKFIFLKSWWNPDVSSKGIILSEQTNIALNHCSGKYCQYIQGDEVLHEDGLKYIHDAVMDLEKKPAINGLVFDYLHFYGNTNVIKYTRNIYRREVRLIRGQVGIKSWLDAQGFRDKNDQKILCKRVNARIFHYGWARKEQVMNHKVGQFNKIYHGKAYESKTFQYERIWGLKKFEGTHPENMKNWVNQHKNEVDIMKLKRKHECKNIGLALSDLIESLTNYRIGEYKNYKLI